MLVLFVVLPLLIIDQLTKIIILKNFQPGDSFPVIKNIFHITFVRNKGVAFGIFSETDSIIIWFSFVAAILIVLILIFSGKFFQKARSSRIFLSLILAGAVGNLIDRIRFGYVLDFLDFRIWPVFNIADTAITVGTALLIFRMLRHKP